MPEQSHVLLSEKMGEPAVGWAAVNFNRAFSSHGLRKRTKGQVHTGTTDHSPEEEVVVTEHFLEDGGTCAGS